MLLRTATVMLLALALLFGAAPAPSAPTAARALPGADAPPTVAERLDGLPSGTSAQAAAGVSRSRAVRTPVPYSLLGFGLPDGANLRFRTSVDGQRWSDWQEADAPEDDEGPDPGSAEAAAAGAGGSGWMSEPVWVGEARWLQLDVAGARPEQVRVDLVDTLGLSRSWMRQAADGLRAALRPSPRAAAAELDRPPVVSRADWGADESLRRGDPSYARRARLGIVHHTATSNDYDRSEAAAVVRAIYHYHTRSLGWRDIGYNLLIDRFGTVYEGRAGGLDRAVVGAHAGGFNAASFGVSVIGTFGSHTPPAAAMDALDEVLAWKSDVHHLDATGTVEVRSNGSTRFPAGEVVTLPTIIGHRDVSRTECPGDALYGELGDIRERVRDLATDMLLEHEADPDRVQLYAGRADDGPVRLTARLRPAGDWAVEVHDPDGEVIHRDSGSGTAAVSSWDPGDGNQPGRHTYTFSSPGRRDASDWVELMRPVISDPRASPAQVTRTVDGELTEDVGFRAELWPDAGWALEVRDPDGEIVHRDSGSAGRLRSVWRGRIPAAGEYRWRMEADEAEPARGTVLVRQELPAALERIGATDDPVGDAVDISRVAFPDALAARHAVLTRADVFADAMAGGPLAGRDGPVLFTASDRLDARVRAELERVLPAGGPVYVLGGSVALGDAVVTALEERWPVVRLAGGERTATAAAVAAEVVRASGTATAMVARAGPDDRAPWADALAGGAYGAAAGVPVLLTDSDRLSPATRAAVRELGVTDTVVLGGVSAVADDVLDQLPRATRVSGPNRAATAVAVSARLWQRTAGSDGDRVLLAAGYRPDSWTWALASSPLAAGAGAPLLLADAAALPQETGDYLTELGYGPGRSASGWVLGDESTVDQSVADAVSALLR